MSFLKKWSAPEQRRSIKRACRVIEIVTAGGSCSSRFCCCARPAAPILDQIERQIEIPGPLDADQRQGMMEIADRCPVHRTLQGKIDVVTTEKSPAEEKGRIVSRRLPSPPQTIVKHLVVGLAAEQRIHLVLDCLSLLAQEPFFPVRRRFPGADDQEHIGTVVAFHGFAGDVAGLGRCQRAHLPEQLEHVSSFVTRDRTCDQYLDAHGILLFSWGGNNACNRSLRIVDRTFPGY